MHQYNLYEAKTHLFQLVQAALDGEEVLIARAGKPAVRLVPQDIECLPETAKMAAVPERILKHPVGSLAARRDEIAGAIDFLVHGFRASRKRTHGPL
ncbi:MAG: type II toxin-antitoxin system prevent-host-death family antitoxin [Rhodocyclaceae bacterium]|nr:type II toxin-antitoxin system prevent-host-death family antitoxin [Rhodocyclaceae bacterium]